MPALEVVECRDYEAFSREWHGNDPPAHDDTDTRLLWQLLDRLDADELLIRIPTWLAEEKTALGGGGTPSAFVVRPERETEKALLVAESAAAPQLARTAHRIRKLEAGVEKAAGDAPRSEWLEDRLREHRRAFETRNGTVGLSDEWIPKSQIQRAVRRVE